MASLLRLPSDIFILRSGLQEPRERHVQARSVPEHNPQPHLRVRVVIEMELAELHRQGMTLLIAEQAVSLALEIADYGYVLQTGRTVLEGTAAALADNQEVQQAYLGVSGSPAFAY